MINQWWWISCCTAAIAVSFSFWSSFARFDVLVSTTSLKGLRCRWDVSCPWIIAWSYYVYWTPHGGIGTDQSMEGLSRRWMMCGMELWPIILRILDLGMDDEGVFFFCGESVVERKSFCWSVRILSLSSKSVQTRYLPTHLPNNGCRINMPPFGFPSSTASHTRSSLCIGEWGPLSLSRLSWPSFMLE